MRFPLNCWKFSLRSWQNFISQYRQLRRLLKTRTTTWNLPGPSGTRDCINIVNLSHPSPSSVEANTDVIHNQRQKTIEVASVSLFRHILNTKSWLECCFSLLNSRMWPCKIGLTNLHDSCGSWHLYHFCRFTCVHEGHFMFCKKGGISSRVES